MRTRATSPRSKWERETRLAALRAVRDGSPGSRERQSSPDDVIRARRAYDARPLPGGDAHMRAAEPEGLIGSSPCLLTLRLHAEIGPPRGGEFPVSAAARFHRASPALRERDRARESPHVLTGRAFCRGVFTGTDADEIAPRRRARGSTIAHVPNGSVAETLRPRKRVIRPTPRARRGKRERYPGARERHLSAWIATTARSTADGKAFDWTEWAVSRTSKEPSSRASARERAALFAAARALGIGCLTQERTRRTIEGKIRQLFDALSEWDQKNIPINALLRRVRGRFVPESLVTRCINGGRLPAFSKDPPGREHRRLLADYAEGRPPSITRDGSPRSWASSST